MYEGGNNIYNGFAGISTPAFNPIRDTIFGGNESSYRATQMVGLGLASASLGAVPFVSPLVSSIVPQGIAAGTGLMLSAQDANEMGSVGITELPRTPVQQNYLNVMQQSGISSEDMAGIEGVSNADFYVTPSGEAIPSTGYRYMSQNAPYIDSLKENMTIPENPNGTYFSFDKYDIANPGALQVPHDAAYRASFDTLQVIDDIKVPNGNWGKADYLEPLTNDFPQFGQGGATQVITNKRINLNDITKLPQCLPSVVK